MQENDLSTEKLLKLAEIADFHGKFDVADAITDNLIRSNSFTKIAQYVGVLNYVMKNTRCINNCVRQKRVSSNESMQQITMECLKEYQDSVSNLYDTDFISKYASSASKHQIDQLFSVGISKYKMVPDVVADKLILDIKKANNLDSDLENFYNTLDKIKEASLHTHPEFSDLYDLDNLIKEAGLFDSIGKGIGAIGRGIGKAFNAGSYFLFQKQKIDALRSNINQLNMLATQAYQAIQNLLANPRINQKGREAIVRTWGNGVRGNIPQLRQVLQQMLSASSKPPQNAESVAMDALSQPSGSFSSTGTMPTNTSTSGAGQAANFTSDHRNKKHLTTVLPGQTSTASFNYSKSIKIAQQVQNAVGDLITPVITLLDEINPYVQSINQQMSELTTTGKAANSPDTLPLIQNLMNASRGLAMNPVDVKNINRMQTLLTQFSQVLQGKQQQQQQQQPQPQQQSQTALPQATSPGSDQVAPVAPSGNPSSPSVAGPDVYGPILKFMNTPESDKLANPQTITALQSVLHVPGLSSEVLTTLQYLIGGLQSKIKETSGNEYPIAGENASPGENI